MLCDQILWPVSFYCGTMNLVSEDVCCHISKARPHLPVKTKSCWSRQVDRTCPKLVYVNAAVRLDTPQPQLFFGCEYKCGCVYRIYRLLLVVPVADVISCRKVLIWLLARIDKPGHTELLEVQGIWL